jgi:hypothetical protein
MPIVERWTGRRLAVKSKRDQSISKAWCLGTYGDFSGKLLDINPGSKAAKNTRILVSQDAELGMQIKTDKGKWWGIAVRGVRPLLSRLENVDNSLFYTIRLDGHHSFSASLPEMLP